MKPYLYLMLVLIALTSVIRGQGPPISSAGISPSTSRCTSYITSIIHPAIDSFQITYNSCGKLRQITMQPGDIISTFTYADSSLIVDTMVKGMADKQVIYQLDKDDFPAFSKEKNFYANRITECTYSYCYSYSYCYQQKLISQIKQVSYFQDNPAEKEIEYYRYLWKKGNPVQLTRYDKRHRPKEKTDFSYDTTRPAQSGDFWSLDALLSGISLVQPKNLLTAMTGAEETVIQYEFDNEGKIMVLRQIEACDTLITNYQYTCP